MAKPFTFTAFGDEGIPGPTLGQDPSPLPNCHWEEWNNGTYDDDDPDNPKKTGVNTSPRSPRSATWSAAPSSRFTLQAGDLCYAHSEGGIQPIINPVRGGDQPGDKNTPMPPANSGGWDYYDPWVRTSRFTMTEPGAASIP